MFARKVKSADFTASLQRFADLHRDCGSRVKHLRLALDALCVQVISSLICSPSSRVAPIHFMKNQRISGFSSVFILEQFIY